ncbi:hypothetical protein ACKXGF_07350 [Alkalibacillus sp. S2W]|uniref:hypothetical protein n=1 Tax=Alkalibacillus sp. S2W TaxID=3386553 RepID=UPI00398D1744
MNEKQRHEQNQIKQSHASNQASEEKNLNRLKEKTSDDFIKYFEATYEPPNLRKAQKRGKQDIQYHDDFEIEEQFRDLGVGKKYLIRTYGCA